MERYQKPFLHFVMDNFLSADNLNRIRAVYGESVFKELHTDLYRFLQTDELGKREDLGFFRDCVMEILREIDDTEGGWLTTFGSYYGEGNYLLCHDDRVENRRFAYSYYLDDYDSGELILYEEDCLTVSKRIEVKSNRLVIFEVSKVSFHEVGYCEKDGRKAFTGWLNFKGIRHEVTHENLPIHKLLDYKEFPFEIDFGEDLLLFYPGVDYDFGYLSKMVEGPFYSRRLERLKLERPLLPSVEGWSLVEGNFYHFRVGDYILLNDRCNEVDGELYDIFFIGSEGNTRDSSTGRNTFDNPNHPVKYLDRDGKFACGLPIEGHNMFVIRRCRLKLFVERAKHSFFMTHFIYKATSS